MPHAQVSPKVLEARRLLDEFDKADVLEKEAILPKAEMGFASLSELENQPEHRGLAQTLQRTYIKNHIRQIPKMMNVNPSISHWLAFAMPMLVYASEATTDVVKETPERKAIHDAFFHDPYATEVIKILERRQRQLKRSDQ